MKMLKVFIVILLIIVFSGTAYSQEKKRKLSVLEIDDKTKSISEQILLNASEYIRTELVSTDRFIVIAGDRQREVAKKLKKESWKDCYDQSCKLELGKELSADIFLEIKISRFAGTYTMSCELVDIAKAIALGGNRADFDGTEAGIKKAIDKILFYLADRPVKYNPDELKTSEVKGVDIGSVKLSVIPEISMSEQKALDFESVSSVGEIVKSEIAGDVDADVLVGYDRALSADKNGKNDPVAAIAAWKSLLQYEKNNPYFTLASKRVKEWEQHKLLQDIQEQYEIAQKMDKYGKIFPAKAKQQWQKVLGMAQNTPYYDTALKRVYEWQRYIEKVKSFNDQQVEYSLQHEKDKATLKKLLPTQNLYDDAQKRTLLVKYLEAYAPFYGIEDVEEILDFIRIKSPEMAISLRGMLFNEFLEDEMLKKCNMANASACFIRGALKSNKDPDEAVKQFDLACSQGITNACIKAGAIKWDAGQKSAADYFAKACQWNSPQGCHNLAFTIEIGFSDIMEGFDSLLYGKACDLGWQPSCIMNKQLKETGYGSNQAKEYKEKNRIKKKIDRTLGADGNDLSSEFNNKGIDFSDTSTTVMELQKYHPYLWHGVGLIIFGSAIVVGGGVTFWYLADQKYDKYNEGMKAENIAKASADGVPEATYLKDMKEVWDRGKLFEALEYTSFAVGGAVIVGGVVLACIPGTREVMKKVSYSFDGKGFYLSYKFEY
jgi:hypothetical protein